MAGAGRGPWKYQHSQTSQEAATCCPPLVPRGKIEEPPPAFLRALSPGKGRPTEVWLVPLGDRRGREKGGVACSLPPTYCSLLAQEGHETQRPAAVPLPEGNL